MSEIERRPRDENLGIVPRAPKAQGGTEQRGQVVRPPKQTQQGQGNGQQGAPQGEPQKK